MKQMNQMLGLCCILSVLVASVHVAAVRGDEAVGTSADKADGQVHIEKWIGPISHVDVKTPQGHKAIALTDVRMASSFEPVPIDPGKAYRIAGRFMSGMADQPSRVLFDVIFLDADKQRIGPLAVFPTTTTARLLRAVKAGETTLRVEALEDWPEKAGRFVVALHAKEDYSDLPNANTVGLASITRQGDAIELKLKKPLTEALPVGSGVRLHRYADYPRKWNNSMPAQWTEMSFTIKPEYEPGVWPRNVIWPGAAYMEIVVRNQYTHHPKPIPKGEKPPALVIGDVTITPVDAATKDQASKESQ